MRTLRKKAVLCQVAAGKATVTVCQAGDLDSHDGSGHSPRHAPLLTRAVPLRTPNRWSTPPVCLPPPCRCAATPGTAARSSRRPPGWRPTPATAAGRARPRDCCPPPPHPHPPPPWSPAPSLAAATDPSPSTAVAVAAATAVAAVAAMRPVRRSWMMSGARPRRWRTPWRRLRRRRRRLRPATTPVWGGHAVWT